MRQQKGKRERCLAINAERFRNIILIFSLIAVGFWIVYGWDSGIDQIFNPKMYGRSFHFSTITTYGLLYYFSSKHLSRVNIEGGKNILYSVCLVALNAMIFELPYMALFQHFQLRRNLIEWLISDFYFLLQYFAIFLLGTWGIWALYKELRGKATFNPDLLGLFIGGYLFCWLGWIFYPGSTTTMFYGEWISNSFFPQTHYAYVHPTVYMANFFLHAVNVGVKSLTATLQLYWLTRLKLCKTS